MRRTARYFVGWVMVVGLMGPALTVGWSAECGEEAQEYYTKGVQVRQNAVNQGRMCDESCLREQQHWYEKAVELCPQSYKAHNNLGDVLEQRGHYPEARTQYLKALDLNPQLAVAHFSLGDLYFRTQEYASAVAAYDRGLRLQPDDTLAKEQRDRAARLQGKETPDAATIKEILDGGKLSLMGPGGIKRDRRLPIHIPFAPAQDALLPNAQQPLHELGTALKEILTATPTATFLVEGHTDLQGNDEYNLQLSVQRARRVVEALRKEFSLPADRFRVQGFGKTRPVSRGISDADNVRNRRVEIVRLEDSERISSPSATSVSSVGQSSPLRVDIRVDYEDAESRPQKLQDGMTLRSGSGYRVFFEAHESCYVYIFQIDAEGTLSHLYPNSEYGSRDSLVPARATQWIPGRDQWLTLSGGSGKEAIYVVASKERRENIEAVLARVTPSSAAVESNAGQYASNVPRDPVNKPLKTMGVAKVRGAKDSTTASAPRAPFLLTTDQLQQAGLTLVQKIEFSVISEN